MWIINLLKANQRQVFISELCGLDFLTDDYSWHYKGRANNSKDLSHHKTQMTAYIMGWSYPRLAFRDLSTS